jgi:hypothetical protein
MGRENEPARGKTKENLHWFGYGSFLTDYSLVWPGGTPICFGKGDGIMRVAIAALLVCGIWACQPADNPENQDEQRAVLPTPAAPVTLTLTDGRDGLWQLDIQSASPTTLFFSRSKGDYRTASYTPLSGSARLERLGGLDTILFTDAATDASFAIKPYSENIRAAYTPFIPFSDGGVAVYTGQFELLAAADAAAVAALDGRLSNWTGEQHAIPLTLKSDRAMLIDGERKTGALDLVADGGGKYVYLGDGNIVEGENFVGVIDPGLPSWIRDDFDETLGVIFTALKARYGYGLPDRATVLFAYRGDEVQGLSNTGGALPGNVLALESAGTALQRPSDDIIAYFRFFFTHEAAHLFQAASGKRLGNQDSAWIHEGQANAVAYRLLVDQGLQSQDAYESRLAETFTRCAEELEGRTLQGTLRTGRVGAYDCGELIALASDSALEGHDLFDLWAAMVASRPDQKNYEAEDYFVALQDLGASPDVVERLRMLTTASITDADRVLRGLLEAAGMEVGDTDGRISRIGLVD